MLTTHDMDDIDQICDRLIMIDSGKKIYDGSLVDLKKKYTGGSILFVECLRKNPLIWRIPG